MKDFDFQHLAKECFGTPPEKSQADKQSGSHFIQWERHANAYLLFYERVHSSRKLSDGESEAKDKDSRSPANDTAQAPKQEPLPLVDNSDVIMNAESESHV